MVNAGWPGKAHARQDQNSAFQKRTGNNCQNIQRQYTFKKEKKRGNENFCRYALEDHLICPLILERTFDPFFIANMPLNACDSD